MLSSRRRATESSFSPSDMRCRSIEAKRASWLRLKASKRWSKASKRWSMASKRALTPAKRSFISRCTPANRPFMSRCTAAKRPFMCRCSRVNRPSIRFLSCATVMRRRRIIASSQCEEDADPPSGALSVIFGSLTKPLSRMRQFLPRATVARWQKLRSTYGAGAGVEAFQRKTTDAVVVLSVFSNPATGSFAKRSR